MASRRLTLLFHEKNTQHDGTYIERPFKQFETLDPRANELVHALTPRAIDALKEAGNFSRYAPKTSGTFKHQLMASCITASIELNARERGWEYIPQHELLERAQTELVVDVDGLLRPDAFFALNMNGKYMAFFLEADRATEPLNTLSIRKSWRHNVHQYRILIGRHVYKEVFNLKTNAVSLNVTNSKKRCANMIKIIDSASPNGCSYILSHHLEEFGSYFKPPKMLNLLDVVWQRSRRPGYVIGSL